MIRGQVTAVDSSGVYVQTVDYGTLGPCQSVAANYVVGDMVLCVDVGDAASPDLVVVGVMARPVGPRYTVGVSGGYPLLTMTTSELTQEMALYRSMGVTWLRVDVDWSAIESTEGEFDWSALDRVVAAASGFSILGVIAYSPLWATSDTGETHAPPTDPADYAAFCTAAATRYAGRIQAWEIWNEPNITPFWSSPDAADYTALVQAAHTAIKAADSNALVLAGALSPATTADGNIAPEEFTAECYTEGIQGYFDAWSVHPYCYPADPQDSSTSSWNTFQRLPLVYAEMVVGGDDDKQIWLTEFGAPTGSHETAVTEDEQADQLESGLGLANAWSWAGPLFYFSGRDRGTDLSDREQNFGFVKYDFSDKPARAALTSAIRYGTTVPAGTPTSLTISGDVETERLLRIQTSGEDRWTVGANANAETGSDAGSDFVIARYDDDGAWVDNPLDVGRADGGVSVNSLWVRDGGEISNVSAINVRTAVRPTITGSAGGNAALASLLTALETLGLIYDSST
ncbi:MAG: cellulase family glycosylhydrolase [Candidatus Nanopelagicales bacterium]